MTWLRKFDEATLHLRELIRFPEQLGALSSDHWPSMSGVGG